MKFSKWFYLFLAILSGLAVNTPSWAISGREIIKEQKKRHDATMEVTHMTMKLVDRQGRKKERKVIMYHMSDEGGLSKSLTKFTSPTDIRNVGLLTWEQSGGKEDDQWLYLPASRQVKRIAGGSKKNQFMGSDLSYEDLRPEDLEANSYQVLGEETIDGKACWKVEAVPADKNKARESGYGRRVFWIRKDIYFTVKVDFFSRRNKKEKTAIFEDLVKVDDTRWRSNRMTYNHLLRGSSTILENASRNLDINLSASDFSQQNLKRPPPGF